MQGIKPIIRDFLAQELNSPSFKIKRLNGYDNVNYLVDTGAHKYVFKTYVFDQELFDLLEAENKVLQFLQEENNTDYPACIPFKDGTYLKIIKGENSAIACRMLSYLEGDFLGDMGHDEGLITSFGEYLARLDLKLQGINNYTLKARKFNWDIQYLELNKPYLENIADPKRRRLVKYFMLQFDEIVRPVFSELRQQLIHNDANEWNVLTTNNTVTGIIDFGDLTHSFLINELAVAMTYVMYDKDDPVTWAKVLLKAYHQILPLEEIEISLLYYLIAARLCMSVCNSAHASRQHPENTYATVSEKNAWQLLHRWLKINPIAFENQLRKTIGWEPKKAQETVSVKSRRHQHISTTYTLSYHQPIHMVRSAFQYMYDAHGNTFLDAYNNIPHVGHSHPAIVEAGQRQMARLNTNTRYLFDHLARYVEKLQAKFPPSLNKVYLVNSGSAATDLALRMAKFHTQLEDIMVMELGYHGNTQTAIEVSDYKFNNPKGLGIGQHILKTEVPDTYKGAYKSSDQNAGIKYAQDAIKQIKEHPRPIAAFIAEPILGCAGQVPLAPGYLKALYPAVRAQGGVCISDEVQTGFGRMGDHFWGYEMQDVIPDIVILGKPIANGHPMGAVICTDTIATSFEKGVEFFSSFGGNPVSCDIASAVLDVIEEEQLQQNAKDVGHYYMSQLKALMARYPSIGDVRGAGLFIGVEIVQPDTLDPNPKLAKHIKNVLRENNILISTDGYHDNILKSKPPLCFNKDNVDTVVAGIESVLEIGDLKFEIGN